MSTKVAVLGSGAMATACSLLLAEHHDQHVAMWARSEDIARRIQESRENHRLLPEIQLPRQIEVSCNIEHVMKDCSLIVAAIPSQFLRSATAQLAWSVPANVPVVSVVKGIENGTFLRPTEILRQTLGERPLAVLSGPSHAEEIARRLPAIVVLGSKNAELAELTQRLFTTDRFRVYTNTDVVGVELAGALKNVIAIAAGIADGLGFGDNAKAALMTRGLVEMTRFGTHFGALPETFAGLAGMGDLVTTCMSPYGRNRKVGQRLGRGESLDAILCSMPAVAEGVATSRSVVERAAELGIEMPITHEVFAVLFEGKSPLGATQDLMLRPLRAE